MIAAAIVYAAWFVVVALVSCELPDLLMPAWMKPSSRAAVALGALLGGVVELLPGCGVGADDGENISRRVLNRVNNSMGRDDLYPFSISPHVVVKLGFIHRVVTTASTEHAAVKQN